MTINRPNYNAYGLDAPGQIANTRVHQVMLVVTGSQCSNGSTNATAIDGELIPPTVDQYGSQRVNVTGGTLNLAGTVDTAQTFAKTGQYFVMTCSGSNTQVPFNQASLAGLVAAISSSTPITMKGDPTVDIYYKFSTSVSGTTIDPSDTLTNAQCDVLFAKTSQHGLIPIGVQSLVMSSSAAGKVRLTS